MTFPREPSPPPQFDEHQDRRRTDSFYVREYTPIEVPVVQPEKKWPSTGFVAALSLILGVILTASVLIGGLGKAFFVTREEHNNQATAYGNDKTDIQKSLLKLESTLSSQNNTLEKQGVAIERLIDTIQTIKVDMARRGR